MPQTGPYLAGRACATCLFGLLCLAGCNLFNPVGISEGRDGDTGTGAPDTSVADGEAADAVDADEFDTRDTDATDAPSTVDTAVDGGDLGSDLDAGPTCDDGVQNGGETDVDCGGPTCEACSAGASCDGDSDCAAGWCDGGTCRVRIEGQLTVKKPGRWSDGTLAASCDAYRSPEQSNYRYASADGPPGDGIYLIEPDSSKPAIPVYCEMDRAGGGWTLVLVSADDGLATWTWNRRELLSTNTSTLGSVAKRNEDYKSRVYHELPVDALLFVHQPSDEWISYTGVGSGSESIATVVANRGKTCYADSGNKSNVQPGIPKSDGTVTAEKDLCSTDLYLNPKDQDGTGSCGDDDHTFGPGWSADDEQGCPMDDPGERASLGPNFEKKANEEGPRGFAAPLQLGSSGDSLRMFVR